MKRPSSTAELALAAGLAALWIAAVAAPASVAAQGPDTARAQVASGISATATSDSGAASADVDVAPPDRRHFLSATDSVDWARAKARADRSTGYRIVVSLQDRHLWTIVGEDTVLSAPVAVAKGTTLDFGGKEWTFKTPRGMRTVLDKQADPIWQPPDWLYAETAEEYGLKLSPLPAEGTVKLEDGRRLAIRDNTAGVIDSNGVFATLPTDEHIVFDNTLFIPPMGTANRKVAGALGKFRLDLGDGYLLHGTPYKSSIGEAVTHGCIRLEDADIEWLYDHVPVGTHVYIY